MRRSAAVLESTRTSKRLIDPYKAARDVPLTGGTFLNRIGVGKKFIPSFMKPIYLKIRQTPSFQRKLQRTCIGSISASAMVIGS
jgi:hypothetical protein